MAKVAALVSFKIFPPHMGGQKGVALFYQYLSKHHSIWMAASKDNWEKIEAPYSVEKLLHPNRKMPLNLGQQSVLAQSIRKENCQVIIAEHSYTGWLAYLLKKRTGRPFIIHSHNLECYRFRQMGRWWWRSYWRYEKWIHRQADFNLFISEEDRMLALQEFGLDAGKCAVAPYGVETFPSIADARQQLSATLNLPEGAIFHFNGTLDYEPNIDAVNNIIDHLEPRLKAFGFPFTILITGKRLPSPIQEKIKETSHIQYLDFVEDINLVYQATDVFLNSVTNDSGVKTKIIEALANHCPVVSTKEGAAGIPEAIAGENLVTVPSHNWDAFANEVVQIYRRGRQHTPAGFFDYFAWTNIAERTAALIEQVAIHESK